MVRGWGRDLSALGLTHLSEHWPAILFLVYQEVLHFGGKRAHCPVSHYPLSSQLAILPDPKFVPSGLLP